MAELCYAPGYDQGPNPEGNPGNFECELDAGHEPDDHAYPSRIIRPGTVVHWPIGEAK